MNKSEMTTTFNIYGDENTIHVYTSDPRYLKKFYELVEADPENCFMTRKEFGQDNYEAAFFDIPMSYLKFKIFRKKTVYDEDRKAKLREYLQQAREQKRVKTSSDGV